MENLLLIRTAKIRRVNPQIILFGTYFLQKAYFDFLRDENKKTNKQQYCKTINTSREQSEHEKHKKVNNFY